MSHSLSPTSIINLIEKSPQPVARRDIAKQLQIKGKDRIKLKDMLRDMATDGRLIQRGKSYSMPQSFNYCDVIVEQLTADGQLIARAATTDPASQGLRFLITVDHDQQPLAIHYNVGDVLYARYQALSHDIQQDELVKAEVIKKQIINARKILGVLNIDGDHISIQITDRRNKNHYQLHANHVMNGQNGDLVEVKVIDSQDQRNPEIKVVQVLGNAAKISAPSFIAIQDRQIPTEFSQQAHDQAACATVPALATRTDLRHIPLVTIDDEDARDFDDAIWAEPDSDVNNPGGWRLLVAIADVSHYVEPNTALDREAFLRGNSVYLPDQVIPMLPEALSNTLCSLQPDQERACLAVEMIISKRGKLVRHKFMRGLMRSAARLTYNNIQAAFDGQSEIYTPEFVDKIVKPLYGAFTALKLNREFRGALNLEIPEQRLRLNDQGQVASIQPRIHHDSHQLIEEFMVMANVAAAIALSDHKISALYRIHDEPSQEKIQALTDYVRGMGFAFAKGQAIRPKVFNALLKQASETPHVHAINTTVLRTQAQAVYSPHNIGHFGLGLARYCHFTSPIRRYADLIVHRALVHGLNLDKNQSYPYDLTELTTIGAHISMTERRAAAAERETVERYIAGYLEQHVGESFECRISGLNDAGLFLMNPATGVEGLVPIRTLPLDYYIYDRPNNRLIGRRRRLSFALGQDVQAKLEACNPLTGGLIFSLIDDSSRRQRPRPSTSLKVRSSGTRSVSKPDKVKNSRSRKNVDSLAPARTDDKSSTTSPQSSNKAPTQQNTSRPPKRVRRKSTKPWIKAG